MFYKVPKIWCTVQHNLTLRQRWRHMRHHYKVLIHIESWYQMVVWPGMQLAIPLYVKMSDSVLLNRALLQFSIILIHLYTGSTAEYTQNASNTQYTISQWPLNRFEWIMAWIVGMDCAQPQIRSCESDSVSILLTVIALAMLNIQRIHHISMTNEQIWMSKSCIFRYEPNVAGLQFSTI